MSFEQRFRKQREDFDRDFERARVFAQVWFVFVLLMTIAILAGSVFVIYKIGAFFGIW